MQRVYPARMMGLGLGALAVGSVLIQSQPSAFIWILLAINGVLWPHLAYFLAVKSATPYQSERLHMLIDTLVGGFWVACMGFNPLVSCIITMMLWMNTIAAGGFRLFIQGVGATLGGICLGGTTMSWHVNPLTNDLMIYASMPMLLAYPVLIGSITYRLAMQLHTQKELLQRLSRIDGLTLLFNRNYWETRVQDLLVQARRHQQPLALILLDVDHFKTINDTYGHAMGDQVLQQLSRQLQLNLREGELLGRYGGEEFALVLPGASAEIAFTTAERLRKVIAGIEFTDNANPASGTLHCTISLGVAAWDSRFNGFSAWLRAADEALYEAKRQGRNRTLGYIAVQEPADA